MNPRHARVLYQADSAPLPRGANSLIDCSATDRKYPARLNYALNS